MNLQFKNDDGPKSEEMQEKSHIGRSYKSNEQRKDKLFKAA